MPGQKDLIINVERRWFTPIKAKMKNMEYREIKPLWTARLAGSGRAPRRYRNVIIVCGYPRGFPHHCDPGLVETFPYRGYRIVELDHQNIDYKSVAHTLNINATVNLVYGIILEK